MSAMSRRNATDVEPAAKHTDLKHLVGTSILVCNDFTRGEQECCRSPTFGRVNAGAKVHQQAGVKMHQSGPDSPALV